ncbi:hypothetical protein E2C01_034997 [Portunus trituberculatus]|uniref:Uncharacterized protein n=1 Tax=Portunus trituberculatus TaxID=210409 RepID=A0A5B7F790_PORTR|nr:hypothetical protein [Portunus trituberculatus]
MRDGGRVEAAFKERCLRVMQGEAVLDVTRGLHVASLGCVASPRSLLAVVAAIRFTDLAAHWAAAEIRSLTNMGRGAASKLMSRAASSGTQAPALISVSCHCSAGISSSASNANRYQLLARCGGMAGARSSSGNSEIKLILLFIYLLTSPHLTFGWKIHLISSHLTSSGWLENSPFYSFTSSPHLTSPLAGKFTSSHLTSLHLDGWKFHPLSPFTSSPLHPLTSSPHFNFTIDEGMSGGS